MRKIICGALALFVAIPAWAGMDMGAADENVAQQQADMTDFFNSLAREKPALSVRRAEATVRRLRPCLPKNMWQEGLEDPCKRATALNAARALAGSGLASVGSAMAGQMASTLAQAASQMIATGDPQFASVGQSLQQESTAISTNNQEAAQTAADQVNATPMPDLSSYTPTSSDISYGNAVSSTVSQIVASVLTVVGTVAGAVIGAYLSFGGGTGVGAMYGASLGSMAGSAIGSAIDGTQPNTAGLTSSLLAGALAQGSQVAQSATLKALTPSVPSQAGASSSQSGGLGTVNAAPSGNGVISGSVTSGNNTGALGGATNL